MVTVPNSRTNKIAGVTLLEMLIVLVIIAGLIGLLLPALNSARESARAASCQNNLRELSLAMRQYLELEKKLPEENEWTRG